VIGPVAGIDGLTVASGHYRNGILLAPITARLVADRILNNEATLDLAAFRPDRFRSAAAI
jgi:glycine oxidase